MYKNEGGGIFTQISANFRGVENGCSQWSDYDMDGDIDLLLIGNNGIYGNSIIYRNEGEQNFTELFLIEHQMKYGEVEWGDYDNDGDPDIVISGTYKTEFGYEEKGMFIYKNLGGDVFEMFNPGFYAMDSCNVTWADWDADGDLDIVANGSTNGPTHVVFMYQNQGNDIFQNTGAEIIGTIQGDVSWGDYDNDGDLDFIISGRTSLNDEIICEIYRNINFGLFAKDYEVNLKPLHSSSSAWADFDRDGDLDLLMCGIESDNPNRSAVMLYENKNALVNNLPTTPENPNSLVTDNHILLWWDEASDIETSQPNLTYNLRVGTQSQSNNIFSSCTNAADARLISGYGNVFHNHNYVIVNLEPGEYFWSIQALDNNFDVSGFSEEQQFYISIQSINQPCSQPPVSICCIPNPFCGEVTFSTNNNLNNDTPIPIDIYNNSGKLIFSFNFNKAYTWNGLNSENQEIPSGIYFWVSQNDPVNSGVMIKVE